MPYESGWHLQTLLVDARGAGDISTDVVLLLEHPPVFTLGRRGGLKNLLVSQDVLKHSGIPVVHVERGGDITFHGPGQLVCYPILDLSRPSLRVTDYVEGLEEVMIRAASDFGVSAVRNRANRGVWVGHKKLGSIGIAIRHGISFHGFAFNVNLSMEPFEWIHPCGLKGVGMTSLEQELSERVPMPRVAQAVKRHMQAVLDMSFQAITLAELEQRLKHATGHGGL